jgi:hypothetical protein
MNARPQTAESPIHYFGDEAGDPTLFNRKGRVIVGDEGCFRYFMLGKLEISEPEVLSAQLAALPLGVAALLRAPRGPVLGPDLAAGGQDARPGPPG